MEEKTTDVSYCLPREIIQIIMVYYPCAQWFRLCKDISILATRYISPKDYRKKEGGALCWALRNSKVEAITYLLKHPDVDPTVERNRAFYWAVSHDHKSIVAMLLNDPRVTPPSEAITIASAIKSTAIVEMLLQDSRVDPTIEGNEPLRRASYAGHKRIIQTLLKDARVSKMLFESKRTTRQHGKYHYHW
jgi:hypothetical protein